MLFYEQHTSLPESYIREKISGFMAEDIPTIDITTKPIIDEHLIIKAELQAEQDLILAGIITLPYFFSPEAKLKINFSDGDFVRNFGIIAYLEAPAAMLLKIERTMLNLIQRLSGIATLTKKYTDIATPFNVKILDTRKTTPGLRLFEKYAVTCGGGYNHRLDLSSGVLIKDNHIKAAGSITNSVNKIKNMKYELPIEIEVENFDELKEALRAGANAFLLDNMKPEKVKEAVKIVRSFKDGHKLFVEASGGINLENIREYVQTGVNAISIGALTHSVKSANIHLEFFNA